MENNELTQEQMADLQKTLEQENKPNYSFQNNADAVSYLIQKGFSVSQINELTKIVSMDIRGIADIIKQNPNATMEELKKSFGLAAENIKKDAKKEIESQAVSTLLDKFEEDIKKSAKREEILTGFKLFDDILGGGLFPGLYILGAISSLGKTSFVLQIADKLAQQGHDVLYFSLEMDSSELIAKSISRLTMEKEYFRQSGGRINLANAKSTRGVLDGKRREKYSQAELDLIENAEETYKAYANHLYIKQGIGNVSVLPLKDEWNNISIKNELDRYKDAGKTPIIIIDYLQLLAPQDVRATDKQNMDKAVMELKRLSRDYETPIIAISSLNRASYTDPVNMSAFKESGAIEYSSDVLIGLQFKGMDYSEVDKTDKARAKRVKELIKTQEASGKKGGREIIELIVLKNRNGAKGSIFFDFWPMFNAFNESNNQEDE